MRLVWELGSARGVKLDVIISFSIFSHLLPSLLFVSIFSVHGSEWFGVGGWLDIHNLRNDIHVTARLVNISWFDLRSSVYRVVVFCSILVIPGLGTLFYHLACI